MEAFHSVFIRPAFDFFGALPWWGYAIIGLIVFVAVMLRLLVSDDR